MKQVVLAALVQRDNKMLNIDNKSDASLLAVINELLQKGLLIFNTQHSVYTLSPELLSKTMETSLGFEQVSLKQKKNICRSRLATKTKSEFVRGIFLDVPLIASNMSTVVDADFCIKLRQLGSLGIMHRAASEVHLLSETKKIAEKCDVVACSVGIEDSQFEFAKKLIDNGANVLCVDVAHGYSDYVISFSRKLKKEFTNIKIIIGNTTNTNMMFEVSDFADAVKVGIGQGFVCDTKHTAGCTERQFSAVLKFKKISKEIGLPIISDGGIRMPSDFVKAIGAGANSVMAGKIFAECTESAAPNVTDPETNKVKKIHAGMASKEVQTVWKNGLKSGTCAEGSVKYIDISGTAEDLINLYLGALRSGITYGGGNDINSFQENADFLSVTKL